MKVEVPEYEILEDRTVRSQNAVLLVVDMQNDFAAEGGALYNPRAEETISDIAGMIQNARANDMSVWFTQDTHTEDSPEFEMFPEHCVRGADGWKIVEELQPKENDKVFQKPRYDGFYGTDLQHQLQVNDISTLVIVGTVANICVQYTAASAGLRYYDTVFALDGISALNDFDYHSALRQASFLFGTDLVESDDLVIE